MASKIGDMLHLIGRGGPAVCNIAVTNSCNARCDFCNFANGKVARRELRWIDASRVGEALQILYDRDIRYVSFFGGEPLLHRQLPGLISKAVQMGMGTALITNGWLLAERLDELAGAGLKTIYISIDSASMATHEANRALPGLGRRIQAATCKMRELGMTPLAQVTISKLIEDYQKLVPLLTELGFAAVAFSYPQNVRLGSSSLAWSADSALVKFKDGELRKAFEEVDKLREFFPVNNPSASISDMKRHLLGEPEHFVCYGGYKSFYMDWNFDIWRCDAWSERMCSVWEFAETPLIRDGCTACMSDCYRDSSVFLHFAVSLSDAVDDIRHGQLVSALKTLADRRNIQSVAAVMENARVLWQLAKLG